MSVLPSAGSVSVHLPVIGDAPVHLPSVQHLAEPVEGGAQSTDMRATKEPALGLRHRPGSVGGEGASPKGLALPLAIATAR